MVCGGEMGQTVRGFGSASFLYRAPKPIMIYGSQPDESPQIVSISLSLSLSGSDLFSFLIIIN